MPAAFWAWADTAGRDVEARLSRLAAWVLLAEREGLAKPQRRINESDLPTPDARLQILQLAIRRLTEPKTVPPTAPANG